MVVNLDGHNAHQSMIHLELSELGLPTDRPLNVRDELTGREFQWGWDNYVSLAPLGGCGPHPVRAVMRYCNGNATVMPLTCMGLSCA